MSKIAIYAGSFDPFTNGHLNIINRALHLFDKIHIVVAVSPHKKPMFSDEIRKEMIGKIFQKNSKIIINSWEGLIVNYACENHANFLIRGLRPTGDFESEFQMASMNKKLNPNIETFFLMTEDDHYFVSSSLVKEVFKHGGDIEQFLPKIIHQYMINIKDNQK